MGLENSVVQEAKFRWALFNMAGKSGKLEPQLCPDKTIFGSCSHIMEQTVQSVCDQTANLITRRYYWDHEIKDLNKGRRLNIYMVNENNPVILVGIIIKYMAELIKTCGSLPEH